jgi:hypothetical protein
MDFKEAGYGDMHFINISHRVRRFFVVVDLHIPSSGIFYFRFLILSRSVCVTIDGVWIGE